MTRKSGNRQGAAQLDRSIFNRRIVNLIQSATLADFTQGESQLFQHYLSITLVITYSEEPNVKQDPESAAESKTPVQRDVVVKMACSTCSAHFEDVTEQVLSPMGVYMQRKCFTIARTLQRRLAPFQYKAEAEICEDINRTGV